MAPRLALLLPLSLLLAACAAPTDDAAAPDRAAILVELDAMVDGSWRPEERIAPPEVRWEELPALLTRVDSTRPLLRFPGNPLSSQKQTSCTEGVMAMWLIERARRDLPGGWPSLNPLILGAGDGGGSDWDARSAANQPLAAEFYRQWWQRVAELPVDEARRADGPFVGTHLGWH